MIVARITVRLVRRYPFALAVLLATALFVATPVVTVGAAASPTAALLMISAAVLLEHVFGTLRAAAAGTLASATGLLAAIVASVVVSPFMGGPVFVLDWEPTATAFAFIAAAACAMPRLLGVPIRWSVGVLAIAIALVGGHPADIVRVTSTFAGVWAGWLLTRRMTPGALRPPTPRFLIGSALAATAAAILLTWSGPEPDGPLAPLAPLLGPLPTFVLGTTSVLAAVLILGRSRIGLLLAVAVESVLAVVFLVDIFRPGTGPLQLLPIGGELQLTAAGALTLTLGLLGAMVLARRWLTAGRAVAGSASARVVLHRMLRSGAGSLGHMASWDGNEVFVNAAGTGAVAYRIQDGVAVTVAEPVAESGTADEVAEEFSRFCARRGWIPVFYSVRDRLRDGFRERGWFDVAIASEAVLPLNSFSLTGSRRKDLRTAVNRASREGIHAAWTTFADLNPAIRHQVEQLCQGWADTRRLPEMGFTLGGLREMHDPEVRLMVALDAGDRVLAVTSWLPIHGAAGRIGWTLDVMRRHSFAMPGVMEFLIVSTVQRAQQEGLAELSLSASPLSLPVPPQGMPGRVLTAASAALEPVYGFGSLARFKEKFGPEHRLLWMSCPDSADLPRILWALTRIYVPGIRPRHVASLARMRRTVAGAA